MTQRMPCLVFFVRRLVPTQLKPRKSEATDSDKWALRRTTSGPASDQLRAGAAQVVGRARLVAGTDGAAPFQPGKTTATAILSRFWYTGIQ